MKKLPASVSQRWALASILLANAFVYVCPAIYATFLSAYFTRTGLSAGEMGILFSLSPLMYLMASPLWARLADRTGKRKQVLALVCTGSAVALLLLYRCRSFISTLAAMLLLNVFVTSLVPLSDSIVLMRSKALGIPFSRVRLGGTLGYAIVVILCGFFLHGTGAIMFPIAAASFLLYAALILTFPQESAADSSIAHHARAPLSQGLLRQLQPEFWFVLAFAFLGYTGLSVLSAYFGAFLVGLGYGHLEIAIASTFSALSEVPTLLLMHRLVQRQPIMRLLCLCCIAFALRLALISLGILPLIYAASTLQSVSYMPLYYCCVTYVSEHLPASQQSQGQSLLVLCQSGLGGLTGYLLGGQAVSTLGTTSTYRLFAMLLVFCALGLYACYSYTLKRKDVQHD